MGLVSILALIILVAWPIASIALIPNRKMGMFIGVIPLLLLLSIVGYYFLKSQSVFTKHTDLSQEEIGGVSIGSNFNSKEYQTIFGPGKELNNVNYRHFIDYEAIKLGVDKDNKVALISVNTKSFGTFKGVKVEDSISKVMSLYGKNVHEKQDEQGPMVYTYVDREANTRLSFWTIEDQVVEIRFFIE